MDELTQFSTNWHYPTEVFFGVGEFSQILKHLAFLSIKSPLWVIDEGLLQIDTIKTVLKKIDVKSAHIFCNFKGNPTVANVMAGVKAYQQSQHDGIVIVGGGSALDTGKAMALMVGQDRPLLDFVDEGGNFKRANSQAIPPMIAVPTTAGTGSEVGRASLIVDEQTHDKKIIFHPEMLPSIVIADPSLTLSLPPHLTAATGMDALAHNLEAFCSPGFHPMADGIALEGMRLIKNWLPSAVEDGQNINARAHLLAASLMGATAFQKGLGAIHSLSHPVGGEYDAHHGLLNAIFMPYVLQFNRPVIEDSMLRLARYLDLEECSFDAVLNWVVGFCQQLNLPLSLKAINIDTSQADAIAERAFNDPSTPSNPRPLTVANLKKIFLATVDGDLSLLETV